MTTIIVALWIISCGDSSIFNSISEFEFFNQDISCNSNEPCTVICDEAASCLNSYIYCPVNYACNISCSAPGSCNDATIQWPSNNIGHISCDTMESAQDPEAPVCFGVNYPIPSSNENFTLNCVGRKCEGAIIYCPQNADCNINCIGAGSCVAAQFIWSVTGINKLICNGESSCQSVNFPPSTDDSNFHFICEDENSCGNANIYCPLNAECHIECIGLFACEETVIHWSPNPDVNSVLSCTDTTSCLKTSRPPIFAANNNENFYFNCMSRLQCYYATIYCPSNGECHIQCKVGSLCEGVSINWPANHAYSLTCSETSRCMDIVHNPIIVPTSQPTPIHTFQSIIDQQVINPTNSINKSIVVINSKVGIFNLADDIIIILGASFIAMCCFLPLCIGIIICYCLRTTKMKNNSLETELQNAVKIPKKKQVGFAPGLANQDSLNEKQQVVEPGLVNHNSIKLPPLPNLKSTDTNIAIEGQENEIKIDIVNDQKELNVDNYEYKQSDDKQRINLNLKNNEVSDEMYENKHQTGYTTNQYYTQNTTGIEDV